MGLRQCFEAADVLAFDPFDGSAGIYNDYLVTPPRVYEEEPYSYLVPSRLGVLWTQKEANAFGEHTVNCFSVMAKNDYPGWGSKRWKIDGTLGNLLSTHNATGTFDLGGIAFGEFSWEPAGYLWTFNGHPFVDDDGAVQLNTADLSIVPGVSVDRADFSGHTSDSIADFAISRTDDRVFIRWLSESRGTVRVYKFSDKSLVATIYGGNETCGIVLTTDGFAYVADLYDWLHVYDFDGKYYGGMRNPRPVSYPGGFIWGWDNYRKRLLFLGGTDHETDGASTLTVQAFFPVPAEMHLTPAIPRSVPRKGKTSYFFAHVCGSGGEPLVAKRVVATTAAIGSFTTDRSGDIAVPVTPPTTASVTLDLEVP